MQRTRNQLVSHARLVAGGGSCAPLMPSVGRFEMETLLMNALREEMSEWLTFLENQVMSLRTNQHIFWEVQGIIRNNPKIDKPNDFYGWMAEMYAAAMSVAVRKMTDKDRRAKSFRRFLEELKSNPTVGRYPVDQSVIEDQIEALERQTESVKKFVDKRIAHHERMEFKDLPTFKELDDAITHLEQLLQHYSPLFTGMGLHSALPTWQYDWKEVFYYPWIENKPQ